MGPTNTLEAAGTSTPGVATTAPDLETTTSTQADASIKPIETQIPPITPDLGGQSISNAETIETVHSPIGITATPEAAANNPGLNSTLTPLPSAVEPLVTTSQTMTEGVQGDPAKSGLSAEAAQGSGLPAPATTEAPGSTTTATKPWWHLW